MRYVITKYVILLASISLTACSAQDEKPSIGMANPASVYCQQLGGKTEIVRTENGDVGYWTLPGGERVEEWTLYRRDHKN